MDLFSFSKAPIRRKNMRVIIGIFASIVLITVIIVPTTIVLTKKNNTTATITVKTTKVPITEKTLSTNKGM
jgi:hypothetical protein